MPITALTSVVRSPNVLVTAAGDVWVALSPTGDYWELNSTGHRIWANISEPTTVGAVAADISDAYGRSLESSLEDTIAFLEQLCALDFVESLAEGER
jgi:hypothetical protein